MNMRAIFLLLMSLLLTGPIFADDFDYRDRRCRPVGSWLINVSFPEAPTPFMFQELLVLNADRTLQETNTALHPNTPPFLVPEGNPPTTGSDGFGAWKRLRGCRIQFSILKFVFAGEGGAPPAAEGLPIGFFRISGIAKIVGNMYMSELGAVKSELILGPDPFSPEAFRVDAGVSVSSGVRLLPQD